MNYWIARNREKTGPLRRDELLDAGLTEDTLVWREGLPTWTRAGSLEELAGLFRDNDTGIETGPAPQETPPPAYHTPRPPQPRDAFVPAEAKPAARLPEKPASYVGWSIAAIVCCCMIPAIVALVFGMKVGSRYDNGDYAGAEKASEMAEIWLIVSIVAGLVVLPFSILLNL